MSARIIIRKSWLREMLFFWQHSMFRHFASASSSPSPSLSSRLYFIAAARDGSFRWKLCSCSRHTGSERCTCTSEWIRNGILYYCSLVVFWLCWHFLLLEMWRMEVNILSGSQMLTILFTLGQGIAKISRGAQLDFCNAQVIYIGSNWSCMRQAERDNQES